MRRLLYAAQSVMLYAYAFNTHSVALGLRMLQHWHHTIHCQQQLQICKATAFSIRFCNIPPSKVLQDTPFFTHGNIPEAIHGAVFVFLALQFLPPQQANKKRHEKAAISAD